jgi:MFS family permease
MLGRDLGIDVGHASWTISLVLAVATPAYGRLSDLVGVRLPLLVGVCLMSLGAVLAAAAPSYAVLLAARVVQGAGAALPCPP